MEMIAGTDLSVKVLSRDESIRRTRVPNEPDIVTGKYWFVVNVTALTKDIYVPISIASGRRPTGFVYQIEGTAQGFISTTDISCKGEGVTQVVLGTLLYAKIPAGITATFRIRIEIRGQVGKEYGVVIREIHYKFDPGDARYRGCAQNIRSKMVEFR